MIVKDELERTWKNAVIACFKVQRLLGARIKPKDLQLRHSVFDSSPDILNMKALYHGNSFLQEFDSC